MRPTQKLLHLDDQHLRDIKHRWFRGLHNMVDKDSYIDTAIEWFQSTRVNNIQGWSAFPCVDVMLGCTHFIESMLLKHGNRIQVLPNEYAYYSLMGIHGVSPDDLEPGVPLLVSLPNWKCADLRDDWPQVLAVCEKRQIDIHIDMAWITAARDISIDLDHPNIKSFGMSISKYNMQWNRIGLRWARQRTMDSITMFNHYQGDANMAQMACGKFIMENLDRDYGWNTYRQRHHDLCAQWQLSPTKIIHVARDPRDQNLLGIGQLLGI